MPIFCTREGKVIQFLLDSIEKNFRTDQLFGDIGIFVGYHTIDQVNEVVDSIVIYDRIWMRVLSSSEKLDAEASSSLGQTLSGSFRLLPTWVPMVAGSTSMKLAIMALPKLPDRSKSSRSVMLTPIILTIGRIRSVVVEFVQYLLRTPSAQNGPSKRTIG
jgi:hypothetical protein